MNIEDVFNLMGFGDPVIYRRWPLPNGDEADVMLLTYGRARICKLDYPGSFTYQNSW